MNAWHYRCGLPVTIQTELDIGTRASASGREAESLVWYGQVD